MSAFFVGCDHINAMLTAAKELKMYVATPGTDHWHPADLATGDIWTEIGKALMVENQKSLASRYPDDWQEFFEGFEVEDYKFEEDNYFTVYRKLTDAIHLVRCYEYQSCEHDGWEDSWAHKFCQRLTGAAANKVPESGPCWEYHKPVDAPKIIKLSSLVGKY
jgi:hypothetical protein